MPVQTPSSPLVRGIRPLPSPKAHANAFGFGRLDAKSSVTLRVDLRILLAGLIQG